ncbi:hypothetical protein OPQ81_005005 [Rhizoctonia solani]|nr:hypothetical protein OPQ81_005005 [Rhizoctonia solani]
MTTRFWDEDTAGEVHLVHSSSHGGDRSRSSGYDSDSSDASGGSMTTIGSDEAGEYFREIYGRRFPVADNLPLAFPVDNDELLRFDLQHAAIKLLMEAGGDVCSTYAPGREHEFEVYNILEGIRAEDATFDLVHCTSTMTTFRDYRAFLPEIRRVLRPGGLFLFCEPELEIFDASDPQLIRPATNAPGLTRFTRVVRRELERQGVPVRAPTQMPAWLDATGGFHPSTHDMRAIPNGPWHPHALMHDVGLMAARVWKATTFSLRPMLLSSGISLQDCESLTQAVLRDLQNPNAQTITKWHMIWACRN